MGGLWLGGWGGGQAPRGGVEVVAAPVQACRPSPGRWGEPLEPAVLLHSQELLNQGPGEASALWSQEGCARAWGLLSLAAPLGAVCGLLPPESREVQTEQDTGPMVHRRGAHAPHKHPELPLFYIS